MQHIIVYGNRILSMRFHHNNLLIENKNNTRTTISDKNFNMDANANTTFYNFIKKIDIFKHMNIQFFKKVNEFEMSIFNY